MNELSQLPDTGLYNVQNLEMLRSVSSLREQHAGLDAADYDEFLPGGFDITLCQ